MYFATSANTMSVCNLKFPSVRRGRSFFFFLKRQILNKGEKGGELNNLLLDSLQGKRAWLPSLPLLAGRDRFLLYSLAPWQEQDQEDQGQPGTAKIELDKLQRAAQVSRLAS